MAHHNDMPWTRGGSTLSSFAWLISLLCGQPRSFESLSFSAQSCLFGGLAISYARLYRGIFGVAAKAVPYGLLHFLRTGKWQEQMLSWKIHIFVFVKWCLRSELVFVLSLVVSAVFPPVIFDSATKPVWHLYLCLCCPSYCRMNDILLGSIRRVWAALEAVILYSIDSLLRGCD